MGWTLPTLRALPADEHDALVRWLEAQRAPVDATAAELERIAAGEGAEDSDF